MMSKQTNIRGGGRLLALSIATILIIILTTTFSFASVTVTKDWNDGLTGTNATNRAAPTVNITGEIAYEQLLNIFYPVDCEYETYDSSFNPNSDWGGKWKLTPKIEDRIIEEGTSGIWTYKKYQSGISECYGVLSAATAYYGTWFGYDYTSNITFPDGLFYQAPVTTFAGYNSSGFAVSGTTTSISNTGMPLYLCSNSATASQKYYIHVEGLWKALSKPQTKYCWRRTA